MVIYGFVYIWYDRKSKKYCIGSHWGSLDDGYITSTGWMKSAFKKRPEDFRRRILYICTMNCKKHLLSKEQYWLDFIQESELGIKYYNLKKHASGGRPFASKETREKMRASKLGNNNASGKRNQEQIDKIRQSHIGIKYPYKTRARKPLSEETKAKIRASHLKRRST